MSIQTIYSQMNREWIFGIGVNTNIDSGESIADFIDVSETWQFSNPFKISIEKKLNILNGIELRATSNKYKTTKKFNNGFPREEIDFYSADISYKLYIFGANLNKRNNKLTGYMTTGAGISWYNGEDDTNLHIGGGINYAISKHFGLNLQTTSKLSISSSDISNNYLQIDFGFIFPINKY